MKSINIVATLLIALGLTACETEREQLEDEAVQAEQESSPMVSEPVVELLDSEHRSEEHRARDRYRNPAETLFFFQVEPGDTVVEINPGGGWYMEILGPLLNDEGQYIAATPDPELEGIPEYFVAHARQIEARIQNQPELYGSGQVQYYDPSEPVLGEPGSADKVLTFRNVHGWINNEQAEAMFNAFAEVLRPGGVLGVVQHRAEEGVRAEDSARSGYVPESAIIGLAEAAGLALDGRTNINANPNDHRDHPHGVWTLPPSLALGQEDLGTYTAIGESDRMTLRFVKPAE